MRSKLTAPLQTPIVNSHGDMTRAWVEFMAGVAEVVNRQQRSGTTADRPIRDLAPGDPYFDVTLGKPIYVNTAANGWVDSAGSAV